MPLYRIKKKGHFMGKYYDEGAELNLHEKQAKYALLSGQLETVGEPQTYSAPKAAPKKASANDGERFSRRTVGGTFGGPFQK